MDDRCKEFFLGKIFGVVFTFLLFMFLGGFEELPKQKIKECERELKRSEKCEWIAVKKEAK